jgi:hypothetical protein
MTDETPSGPPEDDPAEPGAEGGADDSKDRLPPTPSEDDDSALGDTDQHSDSPS